MYTKDKETSNACTRQKNWSIKNMQIFKTYFSLKKYVKICVTLCLWVMFFSYNLSIISLLRTDIPCFLKYKFKNTCLPLWLAILQDLNLGRNYVLLFHVLLRIRHTVSPDPYNFLERIRFLFRIPGYVYANENLNDRKRRTKRERKRKR